MKKAQLIVALLTMQAVRASAALLVDENFDSYENQEAFEAVWAPIGTVSPVSAVLSTGQAASATNSVEVPGTGDAGRYRNQITFGSTPILGIGDQLVLSFDFYDQFPAGNPRSHYVTLQTSTAPGTTPAGQMVSLGLHSNQGADDSGGNYYMAAISGYAHVAGDPDGGPDEAASGTTLGDFFKLNDSTAGLRGDNAGWGNLKLVISTSDGIAADHAFYVDNALAEIVNDVGPITQYSVLRIGSGLGNGGLKGYFDNVRLESVQVVAVPEAGSFAAMGLGGLISAGAVWIKKRRAVRAAA